MLSECFMIVITNINWLNLKLANIHYNICLTIEPAVLHLKFTDIYIYIYIYIYTFKDTTSVGQLCH